MDMPQAHAGVKLDESHANQVLFAALLCGGWATIMAGFKQSKDDGELSSAVTAKTMMLGSLQIALAACFGLGHVWAIFTALAIKRASLSSEQATCTSNET